MGKKRPKEKGFFASNKPENHTSEGKLRERKIERAKRKKE